MPPTPRQYLDASVNIFGMGTLLLMAFPDKKRPGAFAAELGGHLGPTPKDAMEACVAAQCLLHRVVASTIQAVAEEEERMVGDVGEQARTVEQIYADFKKRCDEALDATRDTHTTHAVAQKVKNEPPKPAGGLLDATGAPIEHKPRLRITE